MYGFWVKPDRFVNFQGLYAVYLNQLKILAYRFEDLFTGKTTRLHEAGIDGYIVEAGKVSDVTDYFTAYAMPKAQFKYGTIADVTETIVENLVPGSVLIATEGLYDLIVDNGNGVLKKVDGSNVGTIDYTTGVCKFNIPITDFGETVIGYAVEGTNITSAEFTSVEGTDDYDVKIAGLPSGTVVKELKGGQIFGAQVGLTAEIVTIANVRKFFVGFTTNDLNCQAKILSAIAGKEVILTTETK